MKYIKMQILFRYLVTDTEHHKTYKQASPSSRMIYNDLATALAAIL